MARIPEAELQHLKAAVSLVAVVQQQGWQVVKRGKDMVTLCPFHDEKTPSCVISPAKNLYHCFGCNAGGSVIDWVMHTEKLSLRKAAERLRGELGESRTRRKRRRRGKKGSVASCQVAGAMQAASGPPCPQPAPCRWRARGEMAKRPDVALASSVTAAPAVRPLNIMRGGYTPSRR